MLSENRPDDSITEIYCLYLLSPPHPHHPRPHPRPHPLIIIIFVILIVILVGFDLPVDIGVVVIDRLYIMNGFFVFSKTILTVFPPSAPYVL
jgi:hypothetical protein